MMEQQQGQGHEEKLEREREREREREQKQGIQAKAADGLGQAQPPEHAESNGALPVFDGNPSQQTGPHDSAALLGSQTLLQDPSLGGMPIPDASFLMPIMMANGASIEIPPNLVSADDVALYDRQIRLWGMDAQQRIQNAHILLVTLRGLANEVAKNLVLAGVGSITLLDGSVVTEADLGCQFLLSEGAESLVGQNRAEAASHALRALNPRVQVHVDPESVRAKGPSFFAAYDVVIATDLVPDTFDLINTATRINGRPFYAAGTHGMYGFIFSDLIEHDFVIEREAGNVASTPKQESRTRSIIDVKTKTQGNKTIESVTKRELYSTWLLARDVPLPAEYTASKRRLRSVTPALSCLRALWEFQHLQCGRLPSNRDDLKLFTQIATQKHKALSLPSETLRPEFLRSFLQNLGSEIAPVTAILGGQLAQDVINALSRSQQPVQNTVILDGTTMEAPMYPLHPQLDLGAGLLTVPQAAAPDLGVGRFVDTNVFDPAAHVNVFPGISGAGHVPSLNEAQYMSAPVHVDTSPAPSASWVSGSSSSAPAACALAAPASQAALAQNAETRQQPNQGDALRASQPETSTAGSPKDSSVS